MSIQDVVDWVALDRQRCLPCADKVALAEHATQLGNSIEFDHNASPKAQHRSSYEGTRDKRRESL
jgi:hypothetical protein